MTLLDRIRATDPHPTAVVPIWARWISIPIVAAIVVLGIWVTGAVLTDNFALAQILTGIFLAVAGVAALAVSWSWRALAWPVLGTFVVVAGGLSAWLLLTSNRDVTVQEQVVTVTNDSAPESSAAVQPVAPSDPAAPLAPPAPVETPAVPAGPVALSQGQFVSVAHDTSGGAALIRQPDGTLLVTLTDLATDPGPDLRVYLVPGDGSNVDGAADIGALKGNVGTQQYTVPADIAADSIGGVVIWCRAFSVNFGYATLVASSPHPPE
jgi:hypothetical protein